jgi:hypothetical protein
VSSLQPPPPAEGFQGSDWTPQTSRRLNGDYFTGINGIAGDVICGPSDSLRFKILFCDVFCLAWSENFRGNEIASDVSLRILP